MGDLEPIDRLVVLAAYAAVGTLLLGTVGTAIWLVAKATTAVLTLQ